MTESQYEPILPAEQALAPLFAKVDNYTISHLQPPSRTNTSILSTTLTNSINQGLPEIHTSPTLAKFFALQCRLNNVTHALEVGTLGGYGAIWIASMNPKIHITTIEYSPHHAKVARENIANAGFSDRIVVLEGPALDHLPVLADEITKGMRPKFGFTYIDADKLNNWNYFNAAIGMSCPGAIIVCDNVVFNGGLVRPECQQENAIVGARRVIEEVGKDDRVEGTVMQVIGGDEWDGILYAMVKREGE